eukprot:1161814-Pelagomonas_calceolata.AAC.8
MKSSEFSPDHNKREPLWWRLTALLSQCVSFSLIDEGRVSSTYAILLFFPLSRPSVWRLAVGPDIYDGSETGEAGIEGYLFPVTILVRPREYVWLRPSALGEGTGVAAQSVVSYRVCQVSARKSAS